MNYKTDSRTECDYDDAFELNPSLPNIKTTDTNKQYDTLQHLQHSDSKKNVNLDCVKSGLWKIIVAGNCLAFLAVITIFILIGTHGSIFPGSWSEWEPWTSCSTTCGGGMMSRSRNCTNPWPPPLRSQCEGDAVQYDACNNKRCLSPTVAFRSKDLRNLSASQERTLVFTQTTLNEGDGYNSSTGIFTAPLPGTYSFACQLCLDYPSTNYVVYAIVHNSRDIIRGALFGNNVAVVCDSFDAVAVVRANDTVSVRIYGGGGTLYAASNYWNMFTGMLVHD